MSAHTVGDCLTTGLGNLAGSAVTGIAINRPKEKKKRDYTCRHNFTLP